MNDEEVKRRELKLREALKRDSEFQVKEGTSVEVAQVIVLFAILWLKFLLMTDLLAT